MNITTALLLSGFIVLSYGQSQTFKADPIQPAVAPSTRLQLVAEIDPATTKVGAPINLKLRLKIFPRLSFAPRNYAEFDYELTVTNTAGKEPPRTEFGMKLLRGEVVLLHSDQIELQPGQQTDASLDITKIYQLSQPGTYYARALRRAILSPYPEGSGPGGKTVIEKAFSDPVQFTIVR